MRACRPQGAAVEYSVQQKATPPHRRSIIPIRQRQSTIDLARSSCTQRAWSHHVVLCFFGAAGFTWLAPSASSSLCGADRSATYSRSGAVRQYHNRSHHHHFLCVLRIFFRLTWIHKVQAGILGYVRSLNTMPPHHTLAALCVGAPRTGPASHSHRLRVFACLPFAATSSF